MTQFYRRGKKLRGRQAPGLKAETRAVRDVSSNRNAWRTSSSGMDAISNSPSIRPRAACR